MFIPAKLSELIENIIGMEPPVSQIVQLNKCTMEDTLIYLLLKNQRDNCSDLHIFYMDQVDRLSEEFLHYNMPLKLALRLAEDIKQLYV